MLVAPLGMKYQGVIFIIFFFLLGLYIAIVQPYVKRYHNIRSATNMLIVVIVEILYLYYSSLNTYAKSKSNGALTVPLIVCILLIICVIYNFAAIIYKIVRKMMEKKKEDDL